MIKITQYGKPEGEDGREVIRSMNKHHRKLSEWALSHITDDEPSWILDIGCGGGMQMSLMAAIFPKANITGLDHSPESVAAASETNSDLIASGRCSVMEGSVEKLPFKDGQFDLVTAFETYFFWPDLKSSIAEACRTVAPGGTILIVSESYPNLFFRRINERNRRLYGVNVVENYQMKAMLEAAGMSVDTRTKKLRNWVCFIGRKAVISS